jgi:hypothetical protein
MYFLVAILSRSKKKKEVKDQGRQTNEVVSER